MRGSVTATFVLLFCGIAAAAILWAVHHVNRHSLKVADVEQLRADVVELTTSVARLEGENARLRAETATLKDLATGRKDIQDLTQEIRTMVWMAYGPRSEEAQGRGRRAHPLQQPDGE